MLRLKYKIERDSNIPQAFIDACHIWQRRGIDAGGASKKCCLCPIYDICVQFDSCADMGNELSLFLDILE